MSDQPYQLMPPLSPEEYATLRDDIKNRGVLVSIVRDQHGNLLDGHHRQAIAAELGIDCPTEVRHVADDDEARDVAYTLNLARRHLTREQKRALIAAEIKARPDDSDRSIGRRLGCDHKTVGSVRRELSGEFPHRPALTTAQAKWADVVFGLMRARTIDYCCRTRACREEGRAERYEEFGVAGADFGGMFTLSTVEECDDLDVFREADRRYNEWVCASEETRGVMWDYAYEGPEDDAL